MIKRWTQAEVDLVLTHYGKMKNSDLAEMLNRSTGSLESKARDMGIADQAHSLKIKESRQEDSVIRIRSLGKHEKIPSLPCCLLWHLKEMEGCMDSENSIYDPCPETFSPLKARIAELKRAGNNGGEIAEILGISKTTVYGYIKEMRA